MTRKLTMLWHLRQLMAAKGMFQTTDLIEPLRERGIEITRQMVHRIVTKPPQRINTDLLAALRHSRLHPVRPSRTPCRGTAAGSRGRRSRARHRRHQADPRPSAPT